MDSHAKAEVVAPGQHGAAQDESGPEAPQNCPRSGVREGEGRAGKKQRGSAANSRHQGGKQAVAVDDFLEEGGQHHRCREVGWPVAAAHGPRPGESQAIAHPQNH